MALKMAPNSLFAVLLRSPWWVSLAIAAVLSLLSGAFMPDGYKLVGALSTLPFLVIAALAVRRQWAQPSAAEVRGAVESLRGMAWPAFERSLIAAFEREGYEVKARNGPAPLDLLLERQGALTVVSARRWKSARVGVDVLRGLQAAREQRAAEHALMLSLGEISDAARDFARQTGLELWGPTEMAQALGGSARTPPRP